MNVISEGCAMYEIIVESIEFQHQVVVDTMKEEIKDIHGIRICTIVLN